MAGLTHLVSLQQAAGVEAHFAEFLAQAVSRHPQWNHGWINPERSVHDFFRAPLSQALSSTVYSKYRWGLKLPSRPVAIRAWHCRQALRASGSRIVLIWNRTARNAFVVEAAGRDNCIHWEHGGAWHPGRERERRDYLHATPLALANSKAAARVLELLWHYPGRIEVCRNALRPSLLPESAMVKAYPRQGPVKLGVAARLMPVKAIAVVLHAVEILAGRGCDVSLEVAGAGFERDRLRALAERLGVAGRCRFRGSIRHMTDFYQRIDCLLHVPLTEAFGLVAIEAAAHGCPVIAAAVDGLPEAVPDGASGHCLAPRLSLPELEALGGGREGVPTYVYDPARDTLSEPRAVDPGDLATAVQTLFADKAHYEAMSDSAGRVVRGEFAFAPHVDRVMGIVGEFAAERAS